MHDDQGDNAVGGSVPGASVICFGLDRATDEYSLKIFLGKFADPLLLEQLLPRLSDAEIISTVDFLTGLLRRHLSGEEYHQLFLKE
jgi:hypothetical protein